MEVSSLTQQPGSVTHHVTQKTTLSPTEASSNSTQAASSVEPSADTLSITSSKSIIVQQVVTQQLEIALEINSNAALMNHADYDYNDEHQTDELANKVIQKIHDEQTSNADGLSYDESHSLAVQSVRVKVEQAFEQVRTVLSRLGVMDESAANNVEQRRSQLNQAIDQEAATSTVGTTMVNAASANRELSTALQVTTRDGDIVTINISRSQGLLAGSIESSNGSLAYAGRSSSLQLEISVQGELSEEESESIRKVVEHVNELANKMFNGKTGDAMEKLSEFEINTKQLASMSLNMSSSISYAAVSAYTQVSRLPVDTPAVSPALSQNVALTNNSSPAASNTGYNQHGVQDGVKLSAVKQTSTPVPASQDKPAAFTAVQIVQQATDIVNNVVATENFENPFKEISKLFAKIADMFAFENSHITTGHKDFVKELFNDVVDGFENNAEADDDLDEEVLQAA